MMRKYDEVAVAYPVVDDHQPMRSYSEMLSHNNYNSLCMSQSQKLMQSHLEETKNNGSCVSEDYDHFPLVEANMGFQYDSELSLPLQKLNSSVIDPRSIPLSYAVPIPAFIGAKEIKIMPQVDEYTPVFTPPLYDKKKKMFYHPFFHKQAGFYIGSLECKKCRGSGYQKNNAPCPTCYPHLCEKCWNTGVDIIKNKLCKNKCEYAKKYQQFLKEKA